MHQWVISLPTWYFFPSTHSTHYISQLSHILQSIHPHNWFNNSSIHIIFPSHFRFSSLSLSLSLSVSLSLSLSWICVCARGKSNKKKPQLKQIDHYKSTYLWASLILPQHKYSKSDFFFSFEQKVSKVNLIFWVTGCLRLHHFILERALLKSKSLFLNLKQDLSLEKKKKFGVKKHNWNIY